MRRSTIFLLLVLVLTACSAELVNGPVQSEDPVQVEIISLDHSPIRPAVHAVKDVAAEYGDKVAVQSYNRVFRLGEKSFCLLSSGPDINVSGWQKPIFEYTRVDEKMPRGENDDPKTSAQPASND